MAAWIIKSPYTHTSKMSPRVNNSVGSRPLQKLQTLTAAVLPTSGRPENRPNFCAFIPYAFSFRPSANKSRIGPADVFAASHHRSLITDN